MPGYCRFLSDDAPFLGVPVGLHEGQPTTAHLQQLELSAFLRSQHPNRSAQAVVQAIAAVALMLFDAICCKRVDQKR